MFIWCRKIGLPVTDADKLYYLVATGMKYERKKIVEIVQDESDSWPHDSNKKGVQTACVNILHRIKMEGMQ